MSETKAKKPTTRRATRTKSAPAANAPAPCGGNQATPISVRYCGPTSHPSHHQVRIAAEGPRHSWAAAVIAGLAVVVTVTVAYSAAQASSEARTSLRNTVDQVQLLNQIGAMRAQISALEAKVDTMDATETAEPSAQVPSYVPFTDAEVLMNAP